MPFRPTSLSKSYGECDWRESIAFDGICRNEFISISPTSAAMARYRPLLQGKSCPVQRSLTHHSLRLIAFGILAKVISNNKSYLSLSVFFNNTIRQTLKCINLRIQTIRPLDHPRDPPGPTRRGHLALRLSKPFVNYWLIADRQSLVIRLDVCSTECVPMYANVCQCVHKRTKT